MKKFLMVVVSSFVIGVVLFLGVLFLGQGNLKVIDVKAADSLKLLASNVGELVDLMTVTDLRVNNNLQVGNNISNQGGKKKTPVKIADNLNPTKNKKYNLGSKKKRWKRVYLKRLYGKNSVRSGNITADAVTTSKIAANAVTQTGESSWGGTTETSIAYGLDYSLASDSVTLTTTESTSTLFITISGTFTTDQDGGKVYMVVLVDGQAVLASARSGQCGTADETFTLATNTLTNVSAGTHTVQLGWNATAAPTVASLYNHTLDVIELKK